MDQLDDFDCLDDFPVQAKPGGRSKPKKKPKGISGVPRRANRKMGQEHSALISDDTPPNILSARTLEAVADYIKSGKARHIVVMTGAGISTAAGSTYLDRQMLMSLCRTSL